MSFSNYKSFWDNKAETLAGAMAAVDGSTDESVLRATGAYSARQVAAALELKATDRVLELGCGVARIGRELAPQVAHWHGVDISQNMVGVARDRLAAAGIANATAEPLVRTSLSMLADASFDKAYSVAVFIHMDKEDFVLYLRELRRVLKPGGRLFFDVWNIAHPIGWTRFAYEVAQYVDHDFSQRKDVARNQFSTPQEVAIYLRHAGFEQVLMLDDSPQIQAVAQVPGGEPAVAVAARLAAVQGTPDPNASGWVPLGPRNVGGAIRCVAIRQPTAAELAQKLPLHLAAGSAQGGLWISRSSGYRWEQVGLPDLVGGVGSVAWSSADRNVIYAGSGDLPIGYPGGIGFFKSDDGGTTFKRLVSDSGGNGAATQYFKIVIDPNDAKRAWIGSDTGLWRLDGSSFSAESIPGVAAGVDITDVALTPDPANANQYFLLVGVRGIGTAIGTWDRDRRRMSGWQVTSAGAVGTPWPAQVGIVRVAWGLTNPIPTAHAIMQDRTPVGAPPAAINRPTPLFTSTNLGAAWASVAGANSPEPGTRIAWYALSLAVNPLNVEAQLTSGLVHAINATLYGQQTFANGAAQRRNFNVNRMIRLGEMPAVQVTVLPRPPATDRSMPIGGVGELGVPTFAPALAGALLKLTGQPLRTLPIYPNATMGG